MNDTSYRRLARQAETRRRLAAIPAYVPEPEERLFKLANPENIVHRPVFVGAHAYGLANFYMLRRRACVLRAWCAHRLGWKKVARACLAEAREYSMLQRIEAKREIANLLGHSDKACYRCNGILPCRDCGVSK